MKKFQISALSLGLTVSIFIMWRMWEPKTGPSAMTFIVLMCAAAILLAGIACIVYKDKLYSTSIPETGDLPSNWTYYQEEEEDE